jgi:hypothetical protein
MDFLRLPHFPSESSPPRNAAQVRKQFVCEEDALFLLLTTAIGATVPTGLVIFLDSINDKPFGSHANEWSYPKILLVAGAFAAFSWMVAHLFSCAAGRPKVGWVIFVPIGVLGVLAIWASFCLWGSWVFEYRRPPWH